LGLLGSKYYQNEERIEVRRIHWCTAEKEKTANDTKVACKTERFKHSPIVYAIGKYNFNIDTVSKHEGLYIIVSNN
jgi:hypothetical protein